MGKGPYPVFEKAGAIGGGQPPLSSAALARRREKANRGKEFSVAPAHMPAGRRRQVSEPGRHVCRRGSQAPFFIPKNRSQVMHLIP